MKKIRVFNIQWDTTDNNDGALPPDLPQQVTLDVPDDTDLESELANILSDKYGFCVFGLDYE